MNIQTGTMSNLAALSRLIRLPLSTMVALTALAGALAAAPLRGWLSLWGIAWGIFMLSSASSVLNQVQERCTDALMRRTCRRPLACGELSPNSGMAIGLALSSGGLGVLLLAAGHVPALMGLGALGWYLAVYTPLKRISPLAVIAGTPCGALPPLIGWVAAGGDPLDPRPLALVLLMILWQVPHYWLLALPDRAELQAAGFRVLPERLSGRQMLGIAHFWMLALATSSLLLPLLHLVQLPAIGGLVAAAAFALALSATRLQRQALFIEQTAGRLRIVLHLYLGLVMMLILLDGLLVRLVF